MTQVLLEPIVAARSLARNWRMSVVIVLTLAVTTGASTAVLSIISPALLKPLPVG